MSAVKLNTASGGSISLAPENTASNVSITVPNSGARLATADSSGYVYSGGLLVSPQTGFKNRIINGAMMIDQRNDGASSTAMNIYGVDRWAVFSTQSSKYSYQRNAGSVTPPPGYINYFGFTSLSAYSVLSTDTFGFNQPIEGLNVFDLGWGAAGAQSVTVSFWVRSSLTGTHSGVVGNGNDTRGYPFAFTVSAANTWEYKTVTIPGDVTGTWATDNSAGMKLKFNLGTGSNRLASAGAWAAGDLVGATGSVSVVGTNGATFYITGVQLEKGSVATPFEFRSIGQELALCQRYCFVYSAAFGVNSRAAVSGNYGANTAFPTLYLPVPLRGSPSVSVSAASHFSAEQLNGGSQTCTSVAYNAAFPTSVTLGITVGSNLSFPINLLGNTTAARLIVSAEL